MKKAFMFLLLSATLMSPAFALVNIGDLGDLTPVKTACVETKQYSSCKPGRYLTTQFNVITQTSTTYCTKCPEITKQRGVLYEITTGETIDKNKGDITSCYISAGTYKDKVGTFVVTANCYYSMEEETLPPVKPLL